MLFVDKPSNIQGQYHEHDGENNQGEYFNPWDEMKFEIRPEWDEDLCFTCYQGYSSL